MFAFVFAISDLAVLRVGEPYPEFHNSIEPVLRSNQLLPPGTACRFVAWGKKMFWNVFSLIIIKFSNQGAATNAVNAAIQPDLRVINAPTILTATCNAANIHANRVLAVHICAGSIAATNPVTGACAGNIGSGLYCNNQLAGLLSFGTSCGAVNIPGVYTDIRLYQEWINAQLIRTDNPQPGWMPSPN